MNSSCFQLAPIPLLVILPTTKKTTRPSTFPSPSSPAMLFSLLLLLLLVIATTVNAASTDAVAMAAFSHGIKGLPSQWQSGTDPCAQSSKWPFVSCRSGRVTSLNLANKALSGTLPSSLSNLPALTALNLQNNHFSGPLPSLSGLSSLVSVFLDSNSFSSIPPDFFSHLSSLTTISLDDNPLSPWSIPDDLQSSQSLTIFSARNTSLSGHIPAFFSTFTDLTTLKLSYNDLSGPIPLGLANLTKLQTVELVRNNLSGRVPPFNSMVNANTDGNPLIGKDISLDDNDNTNKNNSNNNNASSSSATSTTTNPSSSENSTKKLALIIILSILLVITPIAGFLWFRKKKRSNKTTSELHVISTIDQNNKGTEQLRITTTTASITPFNSSGHEGLALSYESLKQATNNFSNANILGKGGFGVVYRGDINGIPIAVKKGTSDAMGLKGKEEFYAEIEMFKKVKHRNLVALLGHCVEGNDRLLAYEFMPEGTLGQHLFRQGGRKGLTWKQRLVIALDVARGMEYLHSMAQGSFIHRDLKPSNILLDKDMRAKVSDFGLVKLVDTEKSMMTRLAGTFGYLAPEYAITGKITIKADVYAYGVILMEIIMGRKVLDESRPEEDTHLVSTFHRLYEDKQNFLNNVDTSMELDDESRREILKVAELSIYCTASDPAQRPDMSHSVSVLAPLLDHWKPAGLPASPSGSHVGSCMTLTERLERWNYGDCTTTMDLLSSINGRSSDTEYNGAVGESMNSR
ncbi:Non-specific serine/threonine protein kinase protein [Dioscorea alata]|uniref:Non-specific serine/threonine protein kinase protein n=1 Tax=Dioscorea alata TaxID=55571 RepID=A0ACB7WAR3_DIOAL|nr:Non-specific serine/threonine protein kinase protein [Dioscorea alata]